MIKEMTAQGFDGDVSAVGREVSAEEKAEASAVLSHALADFANKVKVSCIACDVQIPMVQSESCVCGGFVCNACQAIEEDGVCTHERPELPSGEADDADFGPAEVEIDESPYAPGERILAFEADNHSGDRARLFVIHREARGELVITLSDGYTWSTDIGLDEIALWASKRSDLVEIYINEMVLNAKAARP